MAALGANHAVAAVGPPWSSHTALLLPRLQALSMPLVGYRATAAKFSNQTSFPDFGRVAAPDSAQVGAIAAVVRRLFDNGTLPIRLGIISCEDTYCQGLADGVRAELGLDDAAGTS